MPQGFDLATIGEFLTALLIGALIGVYREKRKPDEGEVSIGGLRTFTVISLLGAIGGWLSGELGSAWILAGVTAAVGALLVAGYVLAAREHPRSLGLTTEVAGLVVCLLGAMTTLGHRDLAIPLAIVTAAVLAYKQPLHGIVAKIGWDDIFAGLRLLIATFIILPLLPNRPVDPWGALNPYSLWLLVLLISLLSLVGYVATRWLGPNKGSALTGITGGLVSSTAVTLSFARLSHGKEEAETKALAGGILLAWGVMFFRVLATVLVVNSALLKALALPFLAMAVTATGIAWFWFRQSGRAAGGVVPLKNPFSLVEASKFAAFFSLVLLVVKATQGRFPAEGIYVVAALAGLTDVDAITLSMADFARTGEQAVAVNAVVIAALANTLAKWGLVSSLGARGLRRPVAFGTAAILAAGVAASLLAG